jgi:hypothetical protein
MSFEDQALRAELGQRAARYARDHQLPHEPSRPNGPATIFFWPFEAGSRHGNFHDQSYQGIQDRPEHLRRLAKPHPRRAMLSHGLRAARELDSSNSSDALLMNVFCFPDVDTAAVRALLGLRRWSQPAFGVEAHLARAPAGRPTEIDLVLDDLTIEAKLTEKDFTACSRDVARGYRDLARTFDLAALPWNAAGQLESYQLVRNVMVAAARGGRFALLYDERRPDLLAHWERVRSAIASPALAAACLTATWQGLATGAPAELRAFLGEKYGIHGIARVVGS